MWRVFVTIFFIILFPSYSYADGAHRLAYSQKMGVEVFAQQDASAQWCRAKLQLQFLAAKDSPVLANGPGDLMQKLVPIIGQDCSAAKSADITVNSKDAPSSAAVLFTATSAEGWLPKTLPAKQLSASSASGAGASAAETTALDAFIAKLQSQKVTVFLSETWNKASPASLQENEDAKKAFSSTFYQINDLYFQTVLGYLSKNEDIFVSCPNGDSVKKALDVLRVDQAAILLSPDKGLQGAAANIKDIDRYIPDNYRQLINKISKMNALIKQCSDKFKLFSIDSFLDAMKARTTTFELVSQWNSSVTGVKLSREDQNKAVSMFVSRFDDINECYWNKKLSIIKAEQESLDKCDDAFVAKVSTDYDSAKNSRSAADRLAKSIENIDNKIAELPPDPEVMLVNDAASLKFSFGGAEADRFKFLKKELGDEEELLRKCKSINMANMVYRNANPLNPFADKIVGIWGAAGGKSCWDSKSVSIVFGSEGNAYIFFNEYDYSKFLMIGKGVWNGAVALGSWKKDDDSLVIGMEEYSKSQNESLTSRSHRNAFYDSANTIGLCKSRVENVFLQAKIVKLGSNQMQLEMLNCISFGADQHQAVILNKCPKK